MYNKSKTFSLIVIYFSLPSIFNLDQSRRFCGSDRAILDTTIGFAIANEKIYQFLHFCSILVYDPPLKQYWRGKAMILEGGQLNTLQSISPFMLEDLVYDCQNITSNLDSKISIALSARSKTKISLDYHSLNNEKMVMGFYDQWQSLHDFGEIYMNQSENFTRRIQHPKMTFSLTSQDEILRFYAYWKAEYYSNYFSRSKILISGSEHNYVLVKTVTEVMLYSGTFKFAMESPKGELCLNENQEIYIAFNCETNFSSRNQLLSLLSFAEFGFTHQNVVFLVAKQINRVLIFSEKAFQSFNQMKPVSSIKMDEFFICEDPNKKIRDGSNKAINKAKPTTKTIVKTRLTSKPSTTKSTTFTTPMITKSTTRFLTESSRKSSSKLTVKPTTITTTPTSTSPPPITSITTHTEIKKPITMPSGLKRPRTKPIERIKLVISMATKRANVTHKTTQRSTTILSKSKTDSMELEYDTSTEIDDETIEMNWINSIRKFFSRLIPKNQFGSIILAINGLFLLIALIEIMILCCACCRKRQRKQSKRRKILISSSEIPSNTL
ncbi:hypothetical protein SSS_03605 [Sarcoptes scabiei]|uniref:Uncharacterized protein n=1 Tax=Sarcoptes scabiei TaxID=52283 RepID=A0A834R5B9_SARSC|nr:hypothetical protein SSS_03605 [Sarcoptes scabiei]